MISKIKFTFCVLLSFTILPVLTDAQQCASDYSSCIDRCALLNPDNPEGNEECVRGCRTDRSACCISDWSSCRSTCRIFNANDLDSCYNTCETNLQQCEIITTPTPIPVQEPGILLPEIYINPISPVILPNLTPSRTIIDIISEGICSCVDADGFYGEAEPIPGGGFRWGNRMCEFRAGVSSCGPGTIDICCSYVVRF